MPSTLAHQLFQRARQSPPLPPPPPSGHASPSVFVSSRVFPRAACALFAGCLIISGSLAAPSSAPLSQPALLLLPSASPSSNTVASDAAALAEQCLLRDGDVRLLATASTSICAFATDALLAPLHHYADGPLRVVSGPLGDATKSPLAGGALLLAGGDCGETSPPVETGWHPRSPAVLAYLGSVDGAKNELRRMYSKNRAINVAAVTGSKVVSCNPFSKACAVSDINAPDVCKVAFPDKTKNLHGSVVVLSMFEEVPHALFSKVSRRLEGSDISMVNTLLNHINATPKIIITDGNYGELLSNGTFTGSSGDVIYGRAELACNSRNLKSDRIHVLEFLYPHHQSDMFIFVPNSLALPAYMTIFITMEPLTWAGVMCTLPMAALVWHVLRRARPGGDAAGVGGGGREAKRSAALTFLDSLKIFLGDSLYWEPSGRRERTFYTSWLWFTLITRTVFLGSFSSHLTITHYETPINSIQEWYDSGMGLAVFAALFKATIEFESAGRTIIINERMVLRRRDYVQTMITHRNVSCMTRKNKIEYTMRMREHVAEDGRPLLHLVPERLIMTHVRYEAALHSPLVPRLDMLILRVQQAGLFIKWFLDVLDAGVAKRTLVPLATSTERPPSPLELEHLQTAQLLLAAGLTLAAVVFAAENVVAHLAPRARRHFMQRHQLYPRQFPAR